MTLQQHADWAMQLLRDYVALPSVSAQHRAIDETASFLCRHFDALGLQTETIDGGGHPLVRASLMGDPDWPTLLFYNHYDVQPSDPDGEWNSPPFELTERDGILYGRGTADNKGNLVTRLWALKHLLEAGFEGVNLVFMVEGEEEIGSPSIEQIHRERPEIFQADFGIWESAYRHRSGRPELILGCKGMVQGQLVCRGPNRDMHSSHAPLVESPAWRLVRALSSLSDGQGKVLIDAFYATVSNPDQATRDAVHEIPFDEKRFRSSLDLAELLNGRTGKEAMEAWYFEPTLNIAGLTSGYQGEGNKTVLPSVASAKFDFRLVPDQEPNVVFSQLREHLDRNGFSDIEIRDKAGYPAARTALDDAFVETVRQTALAVYGEEPIIKPNMPASGPMYIYARSMPCVGIGAGWWESNLHAPNESIRVEDFNLAAEHVTALISSLCS